MLKKTPIKHTMKHKVNPILLKQDIIKCNFLTEIVKRLDDFGPNNFSFFYGFRLIKELKVMLNDV